MFVSGTRYDVDCLKLCNRLVGIVYEQEHDKEPSNEFSDLIA